MADVEEDIRWDLEFDKVKDKDNLGLIMEDAWNLTDDTLVSRVQELFDFRNPLSDDLNELEGDLGLELVKGDSFLRDDDALISRLGELFDFSTPITPLSNELMELKEEDRGGRCLRRKRVCGVVKGLKRKLCDKNEKAEDRGGECLRRKRVCGDRGVLKKPNDDVRDQLSYVDKLEMSKRKLREGYDMYSKNRKTSQVLSLKGVESKGKLKNVVITKMTMKGYDLKGKLSNKGLIGQQYSNQKNVCKDGAKNNVMAIDEKKKLNEVFKLSYAERVEMAKAKLQQGYDRCASERKKTCVISLKDIPKPACSKRVGGFKNQHSFPVTKTICGY